MSCNLNEMINVLHKQKVFETETGPSVSTLNVCHRRGRTVGRSIRTHDFRVGPARNERNKFVCYCGFVRNETL
ncbi:unnamed protein product [Dicrocoelium dendriticum]|nr:unnamed protein product [Dicrocoelium dendriticum]